MKINVNDKIPISLKEIIFMTEKEKLKDDVDVLVNAENFERIMRDTCVKDTDEWLFHNKNYNTFNRLRIRSEIRLNNYEN
jgi:hypothetical protein